MKHPIRRWLGPSLCSAVVLTAFHAGASDDFKVVPAERGTLVFVRPRANGVDREGVVIDSETLVRRLKARVLHARGLDEVAELSSVDSYPNSRVAGSGKPGRSAASYTFTHDFGEPFQSLRAGLNLKPLADPEDDALVVSLSLVLGAALAVGLFALYRMAATQVRFAERRNNFVSAVSHELKTPLTAIRLHAEMLDEGLVEDDTKRGQYYRTITRESERLTRLIDDVLSLAQLERGTRRLTFLVGDVGPFVRDALEMVRPHVESQGFTLEFVAPATLPSVRYDPDALKQVLFNLIENAVKYGRGTAEPRITVSCEAQGTGVCLRVRDRGPGVKREHIGSIFEPFFRGEDELTRKNQGTGIGLSLVQGLVKAMGARVRGENAEPGFCVHIELK